MTEHVDSDCRGCLTLARAISDSVPDVTFPGGGAPRREVVESGVPMVRLSGTADVVGAEWLTTLRIIGCSPPAVALGESFTTPRRSGIGATIWLGLSDLLRRHAITTITVEGERAGRTFWARKALGTRFDVARSAEHGAAFARWYGTTRVPGERAYAIVTAILPDVEPAELEAMIRRSDHEQLGRLLAERSLPSDWEPHVGTWIERDDWYGVVRLYDTAAPT